MLNACIIGFGAIAPVHAKAICEIENGKIYGICDIDKSRADNAASKYGAKAFYSIDDALKDKNIDVVHICTPHYLHAEMAIKALQSGKNVVLEKPAAMTEENYENLLCEYKKHDKKVCVVFQNRTNTCIQMLKEIVETNDFGKLNGISGALRWSRDESYYRHDSWRGKLKTEGGGVLINQSVHLLDLMLYFGKNVKSVCADMSNKSLRGVIEVEDTVDALIEFSSGARGLFYATNSYSVNQPFQLELNFENATFRYADNNLYKIVNGEHTFICRNNAQIPGKDYWGGGHKHVLFDFYNALEQKGNSYIDLNDSINTMKTMFAIYKSANSKGEYVTL